MYNARIVTDAGNTVKFGFPYGIIFDISPLNGIDVNIATSQGFQQIGVTVENQSVGGISRDITGKIFRNVESNASALIKYLPTFTTGKLYFNDDHFCNIVVEKTPEIVTSHGKTSFALRVFCSVPYWYGASRAEYSLGTYTPAFSFPTFFDNHIFGIKSDTFVNCFNTGDVETDFVLTFTCEAPVTRPGIINVETLQTLNLDLTMQPSDTITVYRENGRLYVTKESGGIKEDAFYALDDTSTLMWMQPGDNLLKVTADTNKDNLNASISFYAPHVGVYHVS